MTEIYRVCNDVMTRKQDLYLDISIIHIGRAFGKLWTLKGFKVWYNKGE